MTLLIVSMACNDTVGRWEFLVERSRGSNRADEPNKSLKRLLWDLIQLHRPLSRDVRAMKRLRSRPGRTMKRLRSRPG